LLKKEAYSSGLQGLGSEGITSAFKGYLENDFSKNSLLISGPWGCGKTHLFTTTLKPLAESKECGGFRVIYFSLNGLSNSDQVDKAIFTAAYPILKNGFVQASGAVINGLLRYAQISVDELLKVEANINNKTLICIDDLERGSHEATSSVIGKISDFIENKGAKVIILCDESRILNQQEYKTAKEKIIGRTLRYKPSHQEIAKTAVNLVGKKLKSYFPDSEKKEQKDQKDLLKECEAALEESLQKAECSNARIAISAMSLLLDFIQQVPTSARYEYWDSCPRILRTIAAIHIALSEKPDSIDSIELVFNNSSDNFYLFDKNNPLTISANTFVNRNLESDRFPAIYSNQLWLLVSSGILIFDYASKEIANALGISDGDTKDVPPEVLIKNYRKISQEDFSSALRSVLGKLHNRDFGDLNELNSILPILFHLSEKGLLEDSCETSNPKICDEQALFSNIIDSANKIAEKASSSTAPSSTLDYGLEFQTTPISELHERAKAHLKKVSDLIAIENYKKEKTILMVNIEDNPQKFATDILDIRGVFARSALISESLDAGFIASRIINLASNSKTPENLYRISRAFRDRYAPQDMSSVYEAEKPFLDEVIKQVRQHAAYKEDSSLIKVAMLDICEALRRSS
jgi:DNA polymerase III delta prime subunit